MKSLRVGIVGIGKIARDQHIPSLRANPAFEFVACASRHTKVDGVENFATIEEMLDGVPALDAVAICTPPQAHFDAAKLALLRGKHVLLEKPPCTTTCELDQLAELAGRANRTLFQTWHSQYAAGVDAARDWLTSRRIRSVDVVWKEDVRQWHPGQRWIWEAGGFGVFDPGINAISILVKIMPQSFVTKSANLFVPSNCAAPIAANIEFVTADQTPISAAFDFRHTGIQTWDIDVATDAGHLKLAQGGGALFRDGERVALPPAEDEYPSLYRHFANLVRDGQSDVDGRPFRLVADAFLVSRHVAVEPFDDPAP